MDKKFTVYSFVGSQWAGVVHLALADKGFTAADYHVQEVDLVMADNFAPAYLQINPLGTVPSLTSPSLDKPLTESADILRHLDALRPGRRQLSPADDDAETKQRVQAILALVHSRDLDTNLILLQARDGDEMRRKQHSDWKAFVVNRQTRLEQERAANPGHPFYGTKARENGQLHELYVTEVGPRHEAFFAKTHDMYRTFAAGVDRLESLLALPYAAGPVVTEADWHVAPWLAHAMAGAGTEPSQIRNFEPLESLVQKSVPAFRVGPRTRQWWGSVADTETFKKVFPVLH